MGEAQEDLLDLNEDSKPQHKALQRAQSHDQKPSANGSASDSAPPIRRQSAPRRSSSIASVTKDGHPKSLTNHDHFHKLGPSNLASRPRQTRYNTVKIKPGGGSLAENIQKVNESATTGSPLAMSTTSPAPHGGVGTGLLSSAGKEASDGVLAVQQGYGTMGGSPPKSPGKGTTGSGGQSAASQARPAATIQEEEQQPHSRSKSRGSATSNHHSDSESTIGSLHKQNRSTSRADVSPSQRRGTARSGSITEQIVDAGGIRKVVLETTSSSEEAGNNSRPQTNDGKGKENAQNAGSSNSSGGGKGDGDGGGVPLDGQDGGETSSQKKGGGKKKRRRKMRKGGSAKGKEEGDENEPLLERRESER